MLLTLFFFLPDKSGFRRACHICMCIYQYSVDILYVKNVITLSKLIGLLLSSLPLLVLLSVNVHTKNTRNELARLVMGTIVLVISVFIF